MRLAPAAAADHHADGLQILDPGRARRAPAQVRLDEHLVVDRQLAVHERLEVLLREHAIDVGRHARKPQQLLAQRLARAREPRLHGAHRHAERKRNLFVAQAFDLAQHDDGPLIERQTIERAVDPRRHFLAGEQPVRQHFAGRFQLAALFDVQVERHLLRAVPAVPPALAVARLVDDDAEDPGLERRLAAEGRQRPEHAQEDLLRDLQGLVPVAQQVVGQGVDHALVRGDQLRAGGLVGRHAALHERSFGAVSACPVDGAGVFHDISSE